MKKVSKEFYLTDDDFNGIKMRWGVRVYLMTEEGFKYDENYSLKYKNKTTITYEIPEKKVTITESDFDKVLERWHGFLRCNETHKIMIEQIKEKLFGDKNE